jgi:hypothetical protein
VRFGHYNFDQQVVQFDETVNFQTQGEQVMKKRAMMQVVVLVLTCIFLNLAWAATETPKSKRDAAAAWTEDGLQKVAIKGLDAVYVRPDASLTGYDKVLLRPISVAFRRNWEKTAVPGSNLRINPKDSQRIKDNLAGLIREEVIKQLTEGGYQLTDSSGDDVLEVDLSIIDLNVRAPNVRAANNTNIYAVSAGEMTLVAELRDSASSDTVMRIFDHAEAHESTWPRRITSIDNIAEARSMASAWARSLRVLLDAARGVSKPQ